MTLMTGLRSSVGSIAGWALELALPATCAGCYLEGTLLCQDCRTLLTTGCGADHTSLTRSPAWPPAPLVQLEWCAQFAGIAHRTLIRLGETGDRRLSGALGEAIARRWASAGAGGNVIVPVPLLVARARAGGHDQARLLAREAGRQLRLPVVDALRRKDQAEGTAGEVFEVLAPERIAGMAVVLVDGVVTTGATLATCATALLAGGARVVSAVTVVRARPLGGGQMTAMAGT